MKKEVTIPRYDNSGKNTGDKQMYFVDGIPEKKKKELGVFWKTDYVLAQNNVCFYNHKHTQGDADIIAQLRSFYTGLEQPSENKVRRAMILIIDEDYALKAGGEGASDCIYSASLRICIADPTTGEDKDVVLVKKYSTKFENVLIQLKEVEDLFEACLSTSERTEVLKDEARSVAREIMVMKLGGKSNFTDGKYVMPIDFAKKMIALYVKRGVTLPMFETAIDKMTAYCKEELTHEIVEDVEGVNKTDAYRERAQKRLNAFEQAREFIRNEMGASLPISKQV